MSDTRLSQEAKLVERTSESLGESGREEQERQSKVIFSFSIEQSGELGVMENFYKIINIVFKFDLRDNPNGGTYSLLEVAYLKLIQDKGIPLTEDNNISARRLSRMFPIFCVMSFLDSVDFYADLRDQFIEAVGESKLSKIKPYLIDRSYVRTYNYCSEVLSKNNDGQDIRLIIDSISSAHKVVDEEYELERMLNCLRRELLS
jgi:hypothetical protein